MNKRSLTLALMMSMLALVLVAPAAQAGIPTTRVVDDDGMATVADCNASAPVPSTIQGAEDISTTDDTIKVCPGSYSEQVIIDVPGLKVRGAHSGQSAYNCPARSNVSRVTAAPVDNDSGGAIYIQANRVVIDGFTISNNNAAGVQLGAAWYGDKIRNNRITGNVFGVYLQASGAARTYVNDNCIANNNNGGSAAGNGIYSDAGLSGATIDHNSIRGHVNAGMLLLGTGSGAVRNVTITNNASRNDVTAVNLSDVQHVLVYGNTVTQDKGGPGDDGSAIRVGDFSGGANTDGVQVVANTITSPHFAGVAIRETAQSVLVARNVISGTANGIDNTSTWTGAAVIRYNTISGVSGIGIYQQSGTSQNLITNNSITSAGVKCQDDTIGVDKFGVANSWSSNNCVPA